MSSTDETRYMKLFCHFLQIQILQIRCQ